MALIRKFAVQGHAVPKGYSSPKGPFPYEIFQAPERAPEEQQHADSLHEALDDVRMFYCKECGGVLYEDELGTHVCELEE